MFVEIDISGYERAAAVIDKLTQRIEDRDRFSRTKLAQIMGRSFKRAFQTQGASQGSMWAFHTEATKRRNGPHPVLNLTGRLRNSLVTPHGRDNRMRVTKDTFSYGSGVYYAKMVNRQDGSRQWNRIGKQDQRTIENALRDYIVDTEGML